MTTLQILPETFNLSDLYVCLVRPEEDDAYITNFRLKSYFFTNKNCPLGQDNFINWDWFLKMYIPEDLWDDVDAEEMLFYIKDIKSTPITSTNSDLDVEYDIKYEVGEVRETFSYVYGSMIPKSEDNYFLAEITIDYDDKGKKSLILEERHSSGGNVTFDIEENLGLEYFLNDYCIGEIDKDGWWLLEKLTMNYWQDYYGEWDVDYEINGIKFVEKDDISLYDHLFYITEDKREDNPDNYPINLNS